MNKNDVQTTTASYGSSEFKEFPVERLGQTKAKRKGFATRLGSFCGNVIVAAITTCIVAVVIALTYKFIMWLF